MLLNLNAILNLTCSNLFENDEINCSSNARKSVALGVFLCSFDLQLHGGELFDSWEDSLIKLFSFKMFC